MPKDFGDPPVNDLSQPFTDGQIGFRSVGRIFLGLHRRTLPRTIEIL